jgi:hypothetical protein
MLLFMTGIVWLVYQAYSFTLFRTQYLSGWSLILTIVFLAAYNVRKKLPFLPLAASSTWLQFHIYVGWFTFFLFIFHIDFRMPNGILESMLAWLYLFVAVSGVVGLWISRLYPPPDLPARTGLYSGPGE